MDDRYCSFCGSELKIIAQENIEEAFCGICNAEFSIEYFNDVVKIVGVKGV